LSSAEVAAGLSNLPDWHLTNGKLHREYGLALAMASSPVLGRR
jgi:hypothetical protein